ncbi:CPBP family intramembrane metalloprotease [bacterium]|nr:CPBP family intramembrane metalloprotease [bacterium]
MNFNNYSTKKAIATFLGITFALSSIFYLIIISIGKLGAGNGIYVYGLMWCPGIAALITCRLRGISISELGWKWNTRYVIISYLIPLVYGLIAYLAVWSSGFGKFPNYDFVKTVASSFGWKNFPPAIVIALYVLLNGTIGMASSLASALGEEIGWRGFLAPQLAKVTSFTNTALIGGLIWSIWHYPLLLFADYNSGTPPWFALTCFTVMVIAISFPLAWLRLKSGSLWTGAFLHASHNLFIQSILTPLTTDTGQTKYFIDEFGIAVPTITVIIAIIYWKKRLEVIDAQLQTSNALVV